MLDLLEVPFLLKTSGRRGIHFYIHLLPTPCQLVTALMARLAQVLADSLPDQLTVARYKRDRGQRIYLDYLQNAAGRTMAMAYSVRAVPSALISAPIRRTEIGIEPSRWTMAAVLARLGREGNLFDWQHAPVPLRERLAAKGLGV